MKIPDPAKKIGLIGVVAAVSYLSANFLPMPAGTSSIPLVGAIAALGGSAVGIAVSGLLKDARVSAAIVAITAVAVSVASIAFYHDVAFGEPGATAELLLFLWTCGIFGPMAFLATLAGVRFSDE